MKVRNLGFTLIELLVVITIGMIVTGAGLVSLNDFNEKQRVESFRQDLLATLRLARNYAITEQYTSGITDDHNDQTWVHTAVVLNRGIKTIEIRERDSNSYDTLISSKKIDPDDLVVDLGVGDSVAFSISNGVSMGGAKTLSVTGSDVTKTIRIDDSGLIYE